MPSLSRSIVPLLALGVLLSLPDAAAAKDVVAQANVKVRSGPGTRYRVLGTVKKGTKLRMHRRVGPWLQVTYQRKWRFVHENAVRGEGSRRTSRAGFVPLKASGKGYYSYSISSHRWGKPKLVYAIERVGWAWGQQRRPRFGVGDLSARNGGYLAPHSSHQGGEDVDMRPMRKSGEGPVTIYESAYSRKRTQKLINKLRGAVGTELVLFNDRHVSGVRYWAGHDNHFHLRVR